MTAPYDESEFVDTELQASRKSSCAAGSTTGFSAAGSHHPPSREELDSKVTDTQQRLLELKRAQEELERERGALEEARRRQAEFETGRREMIENLTRGLGLMEQAEFCARRDAEQLAKTISGLQDALGKLQSIQDQAWSKENWNVELTRALTTIENARMEWNGARLKWTVLSDSALAAADPAQSEAGTVPPVSLVQLGFVELCRIGLAFTWPLIALGVAIFVVLLLR